MRYTAMRIFRPNTGRSTFTPPGWLIFAIFAFCGLILDLSDRFVSLVKAKTPKIILYSNRAKCLLMENGPNADFEALFYSGWKMVRTQTNLVLTQPCGQVTQIALNNGEPLIDRDSTKDMWYHLKECLSHCERIEAAVNQLAALPISNSSLPFFPLTVGRKPVTQISSSKFSPMANKENHMNHSPLLSGLKSFDGSVRSNGLSSCKTSLKQVDPAKTSQVSRVVEVPGIGRAVQRSSGDVEVIFGDGSTISVTPNSNTILYSKTQQSTAEIFNTKEALPEDVRIKLALVPKAVEQLVLSNRDAPTSRCFVLR